MAESTLSLSYQDLMNALSVAFYGEADYNNLTSSEESLLDSILQDGYKQFLSPPTVDNKNSGYEWKFLKPTASLTTAAIYNTGTIGVSSNTCTISGGVWPGWAYTHGILIINGTEVTIVSRNSDSELTLSDADDVSAGEEDWSLKHDGNYDLPDDFGRLVDGFSFSEGSLWYSVKADVGEGRIRNLRASSESWSRPRFAGIQPRTYDPTSGSRRYQAMFYPNPESEYTLFYKYKVLIDKLTDTNKYPIGGADHAETLKNSVLAKGEAILNDTRGIHWENFIMSLKSSIKRDKKAQANILYNVGAKGQYSRNSTGGSLNYSLTVNGDVLES